jgi:hypothetical protein
MATNKGEILGLRRRFAKAKPSDLGTKHALLSFVPQAMIATQHSSAIVRLIIL